MTNGMPNSIFFIDSLLGDLITFLTNFSKSRKLNDSPKTGVRAPKGPAPLFSGSYSSFCDLLNFTEMPVIDYKHGIWESQRNLKMKRTDLLRPLHTDL